MTSPLAGALAWLCVPALVAGTAVVARAGPAQTEPVSVTSTPLGIARGGSAAAAPAPEPPPAVGPGGWRWPLDGDPVLLRAFAPPASDWGPGHRGVDLAAEPGTVVRAAAGGVVAWAGSVGGRGVVTVAHAGGLRTTYEPVSAGLAVGTPVTVGAPVGRLEEPAGQAAGRGEGHCGSRSCLHWGLLHGAAYLDPTALLRGGPPVLLPLGRG